MFTVPFISRACLLLIYMLASFLLCSLVRERLEHCIGVAPLLLLPGDAMHYIMLRLVALLQTVTFCVCDALMFCLHLPVSRLLLCNLQLLCC